MIATKTFTDLTKAELDSLRRAVKSHGGILRGFALTGKATAFFPRAGFLTPSQRLEDTLLEWEGC